MRAFAALGPIHSIITKWSECVWDKRIVKTETSRSYRNGRDKPKETGQEHFIRHSHCALHGNVCHPLCHVVGEVEGLPNG